MLVKQALKLFADYESEINGISTDLKETVQQDKRREINVKYRDSIFKVKSDLECEANRLAGELAKAQDPKVQMVIQSLHYKNIYDEAKIPDTIKAVMGALPGMDADMLDVVISQAKHPALLLSLYTQANRIEDIQTAAGLRQKILGRVQIPPGPVKTAAKAERECLDALYVGTDVCVTQKNNAARKLDIGRRINALNEILKD